MKITWITVFNTKFHWYGGLFFASKAALTYEYPYFLWNDRVYNTLSELDTGYALIDNKFVIYNINN